MFLEIKNKLTMFFHKVSGKISQSFSRLNVLVCCCAAD